MRPIVRWCLDHRPIVILATVLVLVGGLVGATQLRQQLFPDFDFPFAIVTLPAEGMDARTIDEQVAQPLERQLRGVDGVVSVSTVAAEGQLRIYAELEYGRDTNEVEDAISDAVSATDLPDAVGDPEFAGGFQEQAVVAATMATENGDLTALTERAKEVQGELEAVDGVARVEVGGGSQPHLTVAPSAEALAKGVTAQQIAEAIEASDARINAGVAPSDEGIPVSVVVEGPDTSDATTIEAVHLDDGTPIGDVATVTEVDAADAGFASVNGDPALTISVYRETGKDEVSTVDATMDVLDEADDQGDDVNVSVLYETASDIRSSIKGLIVEGALGALFAVLVIFLFLRSVRGTLIAAISIPTSLVFGILAAWMFGLTINIITLAGLTIAIGRVIDDGIVVLENIHKHLERGASRRDAMVEGTSEVGVAIASSTIATAAVFLPIGLVGGLISEIFLSFSIIVTMALLASLLVAVTVIPVVGSMVLKPSKTPHDPETDTLARWVVPATRFGIRWRWPVLGAAIASMVLVFGLVGSGAIPTQFLPEEGASRVIGTVSLPPGTSVEDAKEALAPLEEEIGGIEHLDDVQLTYGIASDNAAFDPTITPSTAEFFLTLTDDGDADAVEADLREFGTKEYPDAFSVMRLTDGPPSGTFQVNLEGDDLESIAEAATVVDERLREGAEDWELVEIEPQAAQSIPQLLVRAKPDAPVTAASIDAALRGVTSPISVPRGTGTPVTVRAEVPVTADPAVIGRVPVATADGRTVPLATVATFEQVDAPTFVNRVEGSLSGSITARMLGEDTAGTTAEIKEEVEKLDLPDGVELDWEQGDAAFVNEMFSDMGLAMIVAIVLVFLILVLFFGSLAHPFTILAPVLFSFIGSFGALIITGRALGLPAMIGQLLLIGIIVSNSILLVDAALKRRRAGMGRDDALITAAKLRVRPVLMTAAATIAALTPLSLGISGEGGIISQSLGTVVIGGLLVATLLTLVVVPAVFSLVDRGRDRSTGGDDDDRLLDEPSESPRPLAGSAR